MAVKIRKAYLAAGLDAMIDAINNNPNAGWVEIRTGAAPATLEAASTGTLLATCDLVDGTVDAFAATATTTPLKAVGYTAGSIFARDADIAATGTAAHFRLFDSTGVARAQGTVGTSGTDLILDSVALVQHGTVTLGQFDLTIA